MVRKLKKPFKVRPRPIALPENVENILRLVDIEVRFNHPLGEDGIIEARATWRKPDRTSITCIDRQPNFNDAVMGAYFRLKAKGYRLPKKPWRVPQEWRV